MSRHVAVVALLGLIGVMGASVAAQTPLPPGPPAVVARGEAVEKRAPDRAWLAVSTEVRQSRADEARRKNAEAMTAVQAALKAAGVAADAIRTTGFSLTPEMEYSSGVSRLKGFIARNQIEVRVDDLEKLADVIDAANTPKGVGLSIQGPRFDLKNRQAAEAEVLRLAVEVALSRAQAMARGAGRTVGAILRVEEHGVGVIVPMQQMLRSGGRAGGAAEMQPIETPIAPGEIEVRASVTLTAEIR
jgi:uncharacterized protein YggE